MLNGLKVIEMATYVAAPAAGGILADWGADVLKIEPLTGCPMRNFFASAMTDGYDDNPVFDLDNRGKRAIAINTSTEAGQQLVRDLIKDADIFITNLRPTQLVEQGLDFASLNAINPRLVYGSVTGFGLQGPEKDKPGFDSAAFWVKSGLAWIMTPKGSAPDPIRVAVGDHVTGISTTAGILAGIIQAQKTGKGCLVESSLLRNATYVMGSDFGTYLRYERISRTRQRQEPVVPMTNFFETKDNQWLFLNIRPGEPDWPDAMEALGITHIADDERFSSPRERRRHSSELIAIADEAFKKYDFEEWKNRLDAAQLIWSPVQSFAQVVNDPQAEAAGIFVDQPTHDGNSYRAPASPIRFHGHEDGPRGPAPTIGHDTDMVLKNLGKSATDIESLIAQGIVKSAT